MKKFALLAALALLAATLAIPSVAAVDPAQGSLTGVGLLRNGGTNFELGATVIDGGTSYVGKENDRSGNCSGDIGSVLINEAVSFNVVCAHFVASSRCCNAGSPKMRFAYGSGPSYNVIKVVDNGIPNPAGQSPGPCLVRNCELACRGPVVGEPRSNRFRQSFRVDVPDLVA